MDVITSTSLHGWDPKILSTAFGERDGDFKRILSVLGLSGIAVLFLPFAYNTSPWELIESAQAILIFVPLLAIPISAASLLLVISGGIPELGWLAGNGLALVAAAYTLLIAFANIDYPVWAMLVVRAGIAPGAEDKHDRATRGGRVRSECRWGKETRR